MIKLNDLGLPVTTASVLALLEGRIETIMPLPTRACREFSVASTTNASATVIVTGGTFTSADVGSLIRIANQTGTVHSSTIATVVSATQITLAAACTFTSSVACGVCGEDSTAAVQAILTALGAQGGGRLILPAGGWLFLGQLDIPRNVSLKGIHDTWTTHPRPGSGTWSPPRNVELDQGTVLHTVHGHANGSAGSFITVQDSASVYGLAIHHPLQNVNATAPMVYPWTIELSGMHACVERVELVNPYFGIYCGNFSHRHILRDVSGQPLALGLEVDDCFDVARHINVHWVSNWAYSNAMWNWVCANGVGFRYRTSDQQVCQSCFCYGYKVGVQFMSGATNSRGTYGVFEGFGFDYCMTGIDLVNCNTQGVHFVAPTFALANRANDLCINVASGSVATLNITGGLFSQFSKLLTASSGTVMIRDSFIMYQDIAGDHIHIDSGSLVFRDNQVRVTSGSVAGMKIDIGVLMFSAAIVNNRSNENLPFTILGATRYENFVRVDGNTGDNNSEFRVSSHKAGTNQTSGATTPVLLTWGGNNYDVPSGFSTGPGLSVPIYGSLLVNAAANFYVPPGSICKLFLYQNGVELCLLDELVASGAVAANFTLKGSRVVMVARADLLQLYAQSSTGFTIDGTATKTCFEGKYI
jgi:hypothetical protein